MQKKRHTDLYRHKSELRAYAQACAIRGLRRKMELTELCKELNNWFEHKRHFGTFEIEDRKLKNDVGLKDGQYFRIVGSIINDGVYRYPAFNLKDESFDGAVWAMAVPPEVIALLPTTLMSPRHGSLISCVLTDSVY